MATKKSKRVSALYDRTLDTAQIQDICTKFNVTVDATTYQPEFLDRVYVLGPGTGAQPVSPGYCLALPSSIQLCSILDDLQPMIYFADPTPMSTGSPFQYTEQVPWATFQYNGEEVHRNLGTLAYYWRGNSGDPGGNTAEHNARLDIACG